MLIRFTENLHPAHLTTQLDRTLFFFSYMLTCEVYLIVILEIMAQMWQHIHILFKPESMYCCSTEMTATFGQTLPRSFKSPYIYYYAHIMKLLCAWLCLQIGRLLSLLQDEGDFTLYVSFFELKFGKKNLKIMIFVSPTNKSHKIDFCFFVKAILEKSNEPSLGYLRWGAHS